MTSPLLALFVRSLSEDAYGKVTYWARAALSGFILLVMFAMVMANDWSGAPGLEFFTGIIALQTVAISLVGLTFFGSAIAEEKQEQTLGLLRMTDLSPVAILLGKSTTRLCGASLLLAAALPFTIFSITLGGVSLGQVIAAYCTIGAYTFLLCNVALLGSVLARHTAGAVTFTAIAIGALLGSGPFFFELHAFLQRSGVQSDFDTWGTALWTTTPLERLDAIFQTGFSDPPAGWQVASNLILGVIFFLLSWAAFGRFCDRTLDTSDRLYDGGMRLLGMRFRRPPRLTTLVIGRKDFFYLYGGNPATALRIVVYLLIPLVTLTTLHFRDSTRFDSVMWQFRQYLSPIFFLDTGIMAARMFRSELNNQTLSTLAVLPVTIRQLAYQKAFVLGLMAMPGMLCTVAMDAFGYHQLDSAAVIGEIVDSLIWSVLFVHLVIWFSLLVKRGAVPFGFVATVVLSALLQFLPSILLPYLPAGLQRIFPDNIYLPSFRAILTASVILPVSALLHFRILRRLETLAAEG